MKQYLLVFCLCLGPLLGLGQSPLDIRIRAFLNEKTERIWSHDTLRSPQEVSQTRDIQQEQRIGVTQKPESEVHAAINPADTNQIAIVTLRVDPNDPVNFLSFAVYSTRDFGQTWFESSFTGQHPGNELIVGGGDPVLAFESDGTLHLSWLLITINAANPEARMALYHAVSEDGGISWDTRTQPLREGALQIFPSTEVIDRLIDKQWMAIDRSNGPSRDNLYMAYFEYQVSPDTLASIRCQSKRRTQSNFSASSVQVNSLPFVDLQFTSMNVDQLGDLHISFWGSLNGEDYALYHARSDDEGASFGPETKIADVAFPAIDSLTGFPASNIVGVTRLYPCPHIVADASNGPFAGNLYAMWTARGVDSMTSEGFDIYFSRSTDGGQSWEVARILNDDADAETHQFFSSLYVNKQGVLIASWYDRRDDPANVETDYYWTYSMDGGQTFASQNAISSQSSDFGQIGALNGGFGVGEYTQVIATDGYAIPIWADGRPNDGTVSIYAAWAPLSGPTTSLERSVRLQARIRVTSWFQEQNQLQISWQQSENSMTHLALYDLSGKRIGFAERLAIAGETQRYDWDLQDVAKGYYILEIRNQEAQMRQIILLR